MELGPSASRFYGPIFPGKSAVFSCHMFAPYYWFLVILLHGSWKYDPTYEAPHLRNVFNKLPMFKIRKQNRVPEPQNLPPKLCPDILDTISEKVI